MKEAAELPVTEIYDGRTFVGSIAELAGGRWEAASADGRGLGIHTSPAAAQQAVLSCWRTDTGRRAGAP